MLYFDNIFGHKRYFCELQYHGIPEEAAIYPKLAKIAKEHNIPMVVANDAHVPTKSEADLNKRRVAMFLRFEKVSSEEEDKTNSEMYIKTQDELKEMLLQILPEDIVNTAIKNTNQLAEYCKYKPEKESHYPVFDKNQDSNALLRKLAYEGIDWRFPNHEGFTQEYQDRLEYELDVICNMGYADYHLIVKDFLEYARACGPIPSQYLDDAPLTIEGVKEYCKEHNWDVGIGVGIGRGSAAGSLVCYLIGITGIDPLKYDLIFERFLNVERISLPDIDSDFRPDIREKTVKYVQNRYGHDAVVSILTESREGVKGAIRDAARYLGKRDFDESTYYLSLGNTIRSKVPNILNISFDTVVDEETNETCFDYMNGLFENDTNAKKILALAKDIEGMFTTYGMHAAGVIIPDTDDITDYIPLRWNPKKERYTTQCNMVQAENNGLLKMDFLGLKNLGIFTDAIQMIEEQENVKIDLSQLEFDDAVFSEIYAKGRTKNVFQFESPGMRKYLKELNPTSIEDIVAMNALYRPGPIDSIPEFIAAKNKGL
jgi:DNA polymerase-3 subunit alpha